MSNGKKKDQKSTPKLESSKNPKEKELGWKELGKYHYLNYKYNKSAIMYVMYINDVLVGMIMVLHFPHPKAKNIKQGHRTVIRPDYQGVGLGNFMIDTVAKHIILTGFRYVATTSSIAIANYRKKRKEWKCTRIGRHQNRGSKSQFKNFNQRITTSWEYIM